MALESTPDGDELVAAHLTEYQKTRNIGRDPRVVVTVVDARKPGQQTPYLAITGTAPIVAPPLVLGVAAVVTAKRTPSWFPLLAFSSACPLAVNVNQR